MCKHVCVSYMLWFSLGITLDICVYVLLLSYISVTNIGYRVRTPPTTNILSNTYTLHPHTSFRDTTHKLKQPLDF